MPRISPTLLLAGPASVVALVVGVPLVLAGVPWWLAAILALAAGVAATLTLVYMSPAVALRSLGAVPLDPGDQPRLANVVEGLCVTHGHREPQLHIVDSEAPNAAILGRASDDAHLVVTTGLTKSLDRLELEAVVARELSQLKTGLEAATVLVAVATLATPLGLRDRLLDRALDRRSAIEIDIAGVRSTRYPPALASAYEKAAQLRPVDSTPAADHLWLLGTSSGRPRGTAHPPIADRIDVLREL